MNIIPAIDIINGQCVRLTQGDFKNKTTYSDTPLAAAVSFEKLGVTNLHLVDLDGAKAGKIINWNTIELLTTNTKLAIDFGGGISGPDDLNKLFDLGVNQVNVGSMAIRDARNVSSWISLFGPDKIILAADVKGNYVTTGGWTQTSTLTLAELVERYIEFGVEHVTCTDISKDGTLSGPSFEMYENLRLRFPTLKITASGGIRTMEDIHRLKNLGLHAAIVGKAFYEGTIAAEQVQTYLRLLNPSK